MLTLVRILLYQFNCLEYIITMKHVHLFEFSVPAQFASVNLGMPRILFVLTPSVFFASFGKLTDVEDLVLLFSLRAVFDSFDCCCLFENNLEVDEKFKSFFSPLGLSAQF